MARKSNAKANIAQVVTVIEPVVEAVVEAVAAPTVAAPAVHAPVVHAPTRKALHTVRVEVSSIVWDNRPGVPEDAETFRRHLWELYKADSTVPERLLGAVKGLAGVNNYPVWVVKGVYKPFIVDLLRRLVVYHNSR